MRWINREMFMKDSAIAYINNDKDHYLSVRECDRIGNYSVQYCLDGSLRINEFIAADNIAEAKHKATLMMREYIREKTSHWNSVENLINEEVNNAYA